MKVFALSILPVLVGALSFNSYDLGFHGIFPNQYYVSAGFPGPAVKVTQWDARCDYDGAYVLLTPRGATVYDPGP